MAPILLSMGSESSTRRPVLNFWPTYGLRTDHSVGLIGFLVWFFCKLPAINAAFVRHLLTVGSTGCPEHRRALLPVPAEHGPEPFGFPPLFASTFLASGVLLGRKIGQRLFTSQQLKRGNQVGVFGRFARVFVRDSVCELSVDSADWTP